MVSNNIIVELMDRNLRSNAQDGDFTNVTDIGTAAIAANSVYQGLFTFTNGKYI